MGRGGSGSFRSRSSSLKSFGSSPSLKSSAPSSSSSSSSTSLAAKNPSPPSKPGTSLPSSNPTYQNSGYYPSFFPFYSPYYHSYPVTGNFQQSNNQSSAQFYNNSSNSSSYHFSGHPSIDTKGFYLLNNSIDNSVKNNCNKTTSNNTTDHLNISTIIDTMHMTDQQRLDQARTLALTLDKLTRSPKRISPSAPLIIPILMITVALFALICLVVKLIMNYLKSKNKTSQKFGPGDACSPDLPTTPELDQTSLATTASMKTRGSLRQGSKNRRNKLPPVSLYQMKQTQSPKTPTTTSKLRSKGAMRALAKASRSDPNRSSSRDTTRQDDDNSDLNVNNNDGSDSPANLSQGSFDVQDEIQVTNQSGAVYAAAPSHFHHDDTDGPHQSTSIQPEVHIVQIIDHAPHYSFSQTESVPDASGGTEI